jgi:hypothetical protein
LVQALQLTRSATPLLLSFDLHYRAFGQGNEFQNYKDVWIDYANCAVLYDLDLRRFGSDQVLMLSGPMLEGHG